MSRFRRDLGTALRRTFVTDAGLETWLTFQQGVDLPYFAAFDLLRSDSGRRLLRTYFARFAEIAAESGHALILESPTWRASADWGLRLGYDRNALADANCAAIDLMLEVRGEAEARGTLVLVSGNMGPRGDGYVADRRMAPDEAEDYHRDQIATFAGTEADLVSAFTMNYVDEAIGLARAARRERMPAVLSFTVETDGRLPSGETLGEAIARTDAETDGYRLHYMINCAHPTHFDGALGIEDPLRERIRGIRANASRLSHAELETSTELDAGDPNDLADRYVRLRTALPRLAVIGGCCGTDDRHVAAVARLFAPRRW